MLPALYGFVGVYELLSVWLRIIMLYFVYLEVHMLNGHGAPALLKGGEFSKESVLEAPRALCSPGT